MPFIIIIIINIIIYDVTIATIYCSLYINSHGPYSPAAQLLSTLLYVWEVRGLIPWPVKLDIVSPMAYHRCDVSLEICVSVLPRQ